MTESADFSPTVIAVAASTYGSAAHVALEKLKIPHLNFNFKQDSREGLDRLRSLQPDILFRQTPHDAETDIPPAFFIKELSFTRIVYTDYGLGILDDKNLAKPVEVVESHNDSSIWVDYDQELHRKAWMLICANEDQKRIYETTSHRGLNAVVTGYPKFDRLLQRKREEAFWPITSPRRRFRLIWHPHHSLPPSWTGFGTFHSVYRDVLQWATDNPEIEIVLEPHPLLLPHYVRGKRKFDDFLQAWASLENTAIYEGDFVPLMRASDAMLTDGISFLAEYQLFGKPLIWIDSHHHMPFNIIGKRIIKGVYPVQSIGEAIELVSHEFDGDPLQTQREETVHYLRPFPDKSAENVLDAIRKKLQSERTKP